MKVSTEVEARPLLNGDDTPSSSVPNSPVTNAKNLIKTKDRIIDNTSRTNLDAILQQLEEGGGSRSPSIDFSRGDVELGADSNLKEYILTKRTSIRAKVVEIKNSLIHQNTGIKLMMAAQIFGSGMAATTRLLETSTEPPFKPSQVLFARMSITYACCLGYMFYKRVPDPILGPKGVRFLLCLRGFFGFFGVFGFYHALIYLDLSDATVIGFLCPCVTGFLAWIFLGEEFGSVEIKVGIASLFGVIVIARPTFLMAIFSNGESSDTSTGSDGISSAGRLFGVAMSLVGVLASALTFVVIRKIGDRAHSLMSVSYFALWCVIVSSLALIFMPGESLVLPQNMKQWGLLLALGMFGFIFQFMMTAAIQRESAAVVTSINYTGILWALLWERVIWGHVPDLLSWVGGSFILCSAIWMAYKKYHMAKAKEILKEISEDYSYELRDNYDNEPDAQEIMVIDEDEDDEAIELPVASTLSDVSPAPKS
ncbi:hypothetical protein AWJ20_939 [Sugiyamaella lignohabitans]|uniref:EamA domain-containing protein n=1 Tax=Sugiyamaella lignohabitans TaxID=796027 RepID=A0A167DAG4_9ASCO|nr:uncharacterized protein AWJ20_939 [Sugiyamaella lignohabitans]ANB12675.1 hypothetical protein AWJ20_939 [Sugiyamaella lignohabitans]